MGAPKAKMKIACPGCRQKLDVTDLAPFVRINCPCCGGDVIAPKPFGTLLLEEPLGQRRGVSSYRALDLTLDREVLVRILDHDADVLGDGFQALARRAAAVNHIGVVPIYSCGVEQGLPYVVTQFMPGGALARRLETDSAAADSLRPRVEWSRSVASGLQAAVAQGVVHGAVTPQCIYLDTEGHAKLGDFGLDVLLAGPPGRACGYGSDVAAYLSPEVLNGEAPTPAADVFGLGAVLYRLLAGRGPCGPVADSEAVRVLWAGGHRPPAPGSLNPEVPQELSDLCLRMLCAEPQQRPPDVAEIVQALTSACQTRAVAALRPSDKRSRNLRVAAPRPQPARLAQPPLKPRPGRDRWVNLLISACIVVALILAMILYVRIQGYPSWVAAAGTAAAAAGEGVLTETPDSAATAMPSGTGAGARPMPLPDPAATGSTEGAPPGPADSASVRPVAAAGGTGTPGHGPSTISSYVARRPRPEGLDFMAAKVELARYLHELPSELLVDERARIDLIGDTRNYLVRLMKYVPFMESKESDIRLRSGPPLRGAVPYCNDSQVAIRVRGESALRMVPWRDLAIEQVIAFLDFYIRVRLDQGQIAGGAKNSALRREVADDCLRTAVLCDWYGRTQEASRYARQASEGDPDNAARVKRLLPDVTF
jgi:serine/threonine-protein kinase